MMKSVSSRLMISDNEGYSLQLLHYTKCATFASNDGHEIDGPTCRAWKCKTWQISLYCCFYESVILAVLWRIWYNIYS